MSEFMRERGREGRDKKQTGVEGGVLIQVLFVHRELDRGTICTLETSGLVCLFIFPSVRVFISSPALFFSRIFQIRGAKGRIASDSHRRKSS